MQPVLNLPALIKHLGGAEKIETVLKAAGIKGITRRGIHKWGQRSAITSDRLAELLYAYALDGEPIDLYRFISTSPPH